MEALDGFAARCADGNALVWQRHQSLHGLRQSASQPSTGTPRSRTSSWKSASWRHLSAPASLSGAAGVLFRSSCGRRTTCCGPPGNSEPPGAAAAEEKDRRGLPRENLGEAAHFQGRHVTRYDGAGMVRLDDHYIRDMSARYGTETANPTPLPADASITVSTADIEPPWADGAGGAAPDSGDYRITIARLADVRHACASPVQVLGLARYATVPTVAHMMAVKRVMQYCFGTRCWGWYATGAKPVVAVAAPPAELSAAPLKLVCYSNAYFAGCLDSVVRQPARGLFLLAGGIVAFWSRLQQAVVRPTMKSKDMALFGTAQEAEQRRELLLHLGSEQSALTVVHEDNTAALGGAGNNSWAQAPVAPHSHPLSLHARACGGGRDRGSTSQHGRRAGRKPPDKECWAGAALPPGELLFGCRRSGSGTATMICAVQRHHRESE
ncbi:unnamed protein product [Phaeothamnion confervicola]